MNEEVHPKRHVSRCIVLGLFLPWLGCGAFAKGPSNAELIAAMPPGTESVIVLRMSMLKGKDSLFRDGFSSAPTSRLKGHFKRIVCNATKRASPVVFVWGGSDFQMPDTGSGAGTFNERAIYFVEKPLAQLRRRLEIGLDIKGVEKIFDYDGFTVYMGKIDDKRVPGWTHSSSGEEWFVAFPDDLTVVSAESRSDIEHMLSSLKEKRSDVPNWWREIAVGHDLDSPVVILRQYPLPLFRPSVGFTHFAMTLPQVTSTVARVSIAAKDVEKAIERFRWCLTETQYPWHVKPTGTGATGTRGPIKDWEGKDWEGPSSALLLCCVGYFGLIVII